MVAAAMPLAGVAPSAASQSSTPEKSRRAPTVIRPLSAGERLLLPFLYLVADRKLIAQRLALTQKLRQESAAEAELKKELFKEAALYGQIIRTTWARLGNYHRPSGQYDGHERRQRPHKLHLVEFDYIGCEANRIYYRIKTRKRGRFTATSALPYGVRVLDLLAEDTIEELSHACHRKIQAIAEDYRCGAWVVVNRGDGMDGLPGEVPFKKVLEDCYPDDVSRCPLILGIGLHMRPHIIDLDSYPHILIGGSAGGGKSNMINNFICQMLYYFSAEELRLYLIDWKRLEFVPYRGIPHLERLCTNAQDTAEVLDMLLDEIGRRTEMLSGRARSVTAWNRRHPDKKFPRVVVIIDEFAELMLGTDKKTADELENKVTRIVNLGRAVAIHLIVCTQRPAVQVVSNGLKINMPAVIAAAVQSDAQSKVILDDASAADLPRLPGRMIYLAGAERNQIQTPHCTDYDVALAIRIAAGRAAGVIDLNPVTLDAQIISERLEAWIVSNCNGALTKATQKRVTAFAIAPRQFNEWCAEMRSAGKVERRGSGWYLKVPPPPAIEPDTKTLALMVIPQPPDPAKVEQQKKIQDGLAKLKEIRAKKAS